MKNKCIYMINSKQELTHESREHIIPASIGGIKKLEKGVVSDQANQIFSPLELSFTRDNPLISLNRQFEGPGKRGSLNLNSATKSKVHVLDNDGSLSLGVLHLGKQEVISQIVLVFDGDSNLIEANIKKPGSHLSKIEESDVFFEDLLTDKIKTDDLVEVVNENDKIHVCIIGTFQGRHFIYHSNEKVKMQDNINIVKNVLLSYKHEDYIEVKKQINPFSNLTFSFDNKVTGRVIAKILFNYLAYKFGCSFVLNNRFDAIRNWIIDGLGDNPVIQIPSSEVDSLVLPFPKKSHILLICKVNDNLIGILVLYGHYANQVILAKSIKEDSSLIGFVCDWKKRVEFDLFDYLEKI